MNTNLTFHKTLAGSLKSNVNVNTWDKVLNEYENGHPADAIRDIINYVDPEIEKRFANADRTEYNIPHGSLIVQVKITEKDLTVNAPFLNIDGSKKIPVLRQVAQLNFTPLTLPRIELNGEQLFFKYECPLDMCEPYKVYDALREICINADNYDDEFISKFDAKRIQEPKIYPYSEENKISAWNNMQLYIKEALESYEQLENKRLTTYLWDVLMVTLLKIDYYCAPQGKLRNEIEKTIVYMGGKDGYYQRLSGGKEFLKKLQTYDRAQFEKDLYRIDVFVPYKFRTNLESVRNALRYAWETSDKEMKALDFVGAVFTLEYGILNFFYSNHVEDEISSVLTKAMENASGKTMQEAARILFDAIHTVMTQDLIKIETTKSVEQTTEKKGFFSKLFGM